MRAKSLTFISRVVLWYRQWSEQADSWRLDPCRLALPLVAVTSQSLQARTVVNIEPRVFVGDNDVKPLDTFPALMFTR